MSNTTVVINLGTHTSVNYDHLNSIVLDDNGCQNVLLTIDNHIAILKDAINALELIRESTDEVEAMEMKLSVSKNTLMLTGNIKLIERYIECGVAVYDNGDTETETETESSEDYNEFATSDASDASDVSDASDDSDTLIGSIDNSEESEESIETESSDEVLVKKKPNKQN